jgi:rubrerythrin
MEEYAHRKNIERFESALARESDPSARKRLEKLLQDERKHLDRVLREKSRLKP